MKIIYTKKFKETISQPWSNISLGNIKLRGGTNTGLTRQDISKIMDDSKLSSLLLSESTERTYESEIISLPGGGIQVYISIPPEDQSFHTEEYFYQVIMFFYTNMLTDEESLAFVCYENIDYKIGEDESESLEDPVIFADLKLTTRKNIITFPQFKWSGNINFSQSNVIKFLESPTGPYEINPVQKTTGLINKNSWESWVVDSMSEKTLTPWIETTFINKYGIKIY